MNSNIRRSVFLLRRHFLARTLRNQSDLGQRHLVREKRRKKLDVHRKTRYMYFYTMKRRKKIAFREWVESGNDLG